MSVRRFITTATLAWAILAGGAPAWAETAAQSMEALSRAAGAPAQPVRDPWEPANRQLYRFNHALDQALFRPPAVFYRHAAPRPVRQGVHNVITNLEQPSIFVNDVLQVRPSDALRTAGRFVVNTTVGVLGVFDVATGAGLPGHDADFGQTLGRYGAGSGPYIFLPVLGPSNVRDLAGRAVDSVIDPVNLAVRKQPAIWISRAVVGGLDARAAVDPALKDIDRTATDPYATIRSAYDQSRRSLISGEKVDVQALPDFGPEPAAGPARSPPRAQATPVPPAKP